jgi:hypothetical protein
VSRTRGNLGELWRTLGRAIDPYRPELHYMHRPGPKWRAMHSCIVTATSLDLRSRRRTAGYSLQMMGCHLAPGRPEGAGALRSWRREKGTADRQSALADSPRALGRPTSSTRVPVLMPRADSAEASGAFCSKPPEWERRTAKTHWRTRQGQCGATAVSAAICCRAARRRHSGAPSPGLQFPAAPRHSQCASLAPRPSGRGQ